MLRSPLADQFGLSVHRGMKEMPVYGLVVGGNGSKLMDSATEAEHHALFSVVGSNLQVTMRKATMENLAQGILESGFLDRPLLDKTGLTGTYDIKLTYTPENKMNRGPDAAPGEISIFTAVREQLGLKLEPQKAMVEILVVDHIGKPTGN